MSTFDDQFKKVATTDGFIAALDQSGGSTPKALKLYGVDETSYSGDAEMFQAVHDMRTRIVMDSAFAGNRILGAILFEDTMNREIGGQASSEYLWQEKKVVPFLKVDKGLEEENAGVQLMKPMPGLDELLTHAKTKSIFGTKMRSVVKSANPEGIKAIVGQQFEVGQQILGNGLIPILEPEVDIHAGDKAACEEILRSEIITKLDTLDQDQNVMLKLTLPDLDNFYQSCIEHPRVLKVVALSGGYNRVLANEKLSNNKGMIASFSRALTEGLTAQHSDAEFHQVLDSSIETIFQASKS